MFVAEHKGSILNGMFLLFTPIIVPVLSHASLKRGVRNLRTIIVIADIDQGLHRPA